jgi:poly-beta-1,6-N-acetyl-D-glucosamine synthase
MKAVTKYVIITPVRNEEQNIASTIDSMVKQTVRPEEWVIVNDGSTDRTAEIINDRAARENWIHAVHRKDRGFRKAGGGVVEAFNDGYKALRSDDWEFIVKLDGDLSFDSDYFQRCFERFQADTRLGIGGGEIYHDLGGKLTLERTPKFHVRGATKIYKRDCWTAIGGLWPGAGWDTIDEVKANMLGWNTYSFPELRLHHHRFTGSADGLLKDRIKQGQVCYVSGYHPLFVVARCLFRLVHKPYVIGAAATLYGYANSYWTRRPRVEDNRYRSYIRGQQLRRLFGLQTIWK